VTKLIHEIDPKTRLPKVLTKSTLPGSNVRVATLLCSEGRANSLHFQRFTFSAWGLGVSCANVTFDACSFGA